MRKSFVHCCSILLLILDPALAEDPYQVDGLTGAGAPAQIFNGDDDPTDLDVTDFGDLDHRDTSVKVFRITNTSDTAIEFLAVSSSDSQFTIVAPELGSIQPNKDAGFAVRFSALHGEADTEITIETDVEGEFEQFTFLLVGNGVSLTWYVDSSAAAFGTGKSWSSPFDDLQDALTRALTGDEILVAQGVYYPDEGDGQTNDSVSSTFLIPSRVSIRGGYAPGGTSRDIDAFPTILSGDLAQNDSNSDGNFILEDPDLIAGLNAGPVVTFEAQSNNISLLEGFTITAGDNRDTSGGGVRGPSGNRLSVLKCQFIGNRMKTTSSTAAGGGLALSITEAVIEDCLFESNLVESPSSSRGGGCYVVADETRMERCLWRGNQARSSSSENLDVDGTASYLSGVGLLGTNTSSLTILECEFLEHQAPGQGHSVLYVFNTFDVEIDRCRFAGNTFNERILNSCMTLTRVSFLELTNSLFHGNELGTQMVIRRAQINDSTEETEATLRNVTMAGNSGMGIDQINFPKWELSVSNSVFHDNSLGHLPSSYPNYTVSVENSLVGGDPAHSNQSGNLDKDTPPNFANPLSASSAPTVFGNYTLHLNSALIDAGDNLSANPQDLAGEARLQDGNGDGQAFVDMGAYEYEFTGAIIEITAIDYNPNNGTIVFTIEADRVSSYSLFSEGDPSVEFSSWNLVRNGTLFSGTSQVTVTGNQYGWPASKMFFRFRTPSDPES